MAIRPKYNTLVNPNKPDGLFICFAVSLFTSYAIYLYSHDYSFLLRSLLAPLLILLNLLDLPGFSFIQKIYWKLIIPSVCILGLMYNPAVLYTSIQVYLYYHSMEAIPQIFTAGETLINSHVLTTIFQFSLTPFNLRSAIILYPFRFVLMAWVVLSIVDKVIELQRRLREGKARIPRILTTTLILGAIFAVEYSIKRASFSAILSELYSITIGNRTRRWILLYTLLYVVIGMATFPALKRRTGMGVVASRKYFHLMCFMLFVPSFVFAPDLIMWVLDLILALLLILEFVRLKAAPAHPYMVETTHYFNKFSHPETHGKFCFAPLSLLGGCAWPLNIMYFLTKGNLEGLTLFYAMTGMIFLTIGDSLNGIFGRKYGVKHWPGSKKTLLGSAATFFFTLLASIVLIYCIVPGKMNEKMLLSTTVSTLLISLLEGYTVQDDNFPVTSFYLGSYFGFGLALGI